MSGPFGSHNFMTKGTPPEGGQSLRFNDDDTAYLSWTPSAAGNRKTWTWSGWFKRGNIGSEYSLFSAHITNTNQTDIYLNSTDTIVFNDYQSTTKISAQTSAVFRDPSAWYHIVVAVDTTQSTNSDGVKVYINGVQQTLTFTAYTQNLDTMVSSTNSHKIGSRYSSSPYYLDGYLSEVNFVDGTALDPTSFGETDANGQWVPIKEPSVTYGTNGFYLPFTNDYEVEGFNTVTYRGNGGTQYVGGVGFEPDFLWVKDRTAAYNSLLVNSVTGVTNFLNSNTTNAESSTAGYITSTETDGFSLGSGGNVNASGNSYVAWAWDMGTVENLVTNGDFDQDISGWSTTQGTVTWDSGRRAYLQGPSGVTFRQTITGLDVSKTYYYTASLSRTSGTGNFGVDVDGTLDYVAGSSYTNYTASGFFTPSSSSIVFDVWGGSGLYLYADDIQIFEANTDGSITSSVKANPTYGQSVISYTGNGVTTGESIGHGLSQRPDMVVIKNRTTSGTGWNVLFPEFMTATQYLALNLSNAIGNSANAGWGGSLPDSTQVYVGGSSWTNTSGNNYIAYCFHSVAGYSSFGSYTGNGSSTGPTVTTGFKPAFVMIKRTDSTGDWHILDNTRSPYGELDNYLYPNTSDAEYAGNNDGILITDTTFQLSNTYTSLNASGGTYIYMAFADKREAAFWLDQSGNNNDWTNNNMQESDISLDNPTNNFATLGPMVRSVRSEGNLRSSKLDTNYNTAVSSIAVSSGKWYSECRVTLDAIYPVLGIADVSSNTIIDTSKYMGEDSLSYGYFSTTWYFNGSSAGNHGLSISSGDILGVALDLDSAQNTLKIYVNGVLGSTLNINDPVEGYVVGSMGSSFAGAIADWNFGQDSSFHGLETAQGNTDGNGFGDFYYEPPAGYLALCTQNLPDPAIADGTEHFNTVLYTGNGTSQSITGVGFQPDFVWGKGRSFTQNHALYDTIRGATKRIVTNSTAAENTETGGVTSFDTDGFSVGNSSSTNSSGNTFVAWNWKADNTSGTSNTDGSITSTVSANTTAGFSIVNYIGTGAAATIGHGLSSAPDMIIVKNRDGATTWRVYHSAEGATKYASLDTSNAFASATSVWNDTEPTSSVFTVGASTTTNPSGSNLIAYCFHSVESYSKFGSYTGNGSTDGPFVYTGFRPAFVMVKATGTASSWFMWDVQRNTYNAATTPLFPNASYAEETTLYPIDFLSNGFKLRASSGYGTNESAAYIYMAFAENPFKYSNAR